MPVSSTTSPAPLISYLEACKSDQLKGLYKNLGTRPPTRKAELIELIHLRMTDPQSVRQLWDKLDKLQQQAVAETVHAPDGRFDRAAFKAKYGADPNWGDMDRWGSATNPSALGLFIYDSMIPSDLAALLKDFVPRPAMARVQSNDTPKTGIWQTWYNAETRKEEEFETPVRVVEMERAAQHDLHAVLRLVDTGKVKASETTRMVSAAGAKAIAAVLQGGDFYTEVDETDLLSDASIGPIKAFAWPLIVQNAGLAAIAGGKLQLTDAGKKALNAPPHETLRKAWQRWQKNTLLDEFNRVDAIKGQKGQGKHSMTAPAGRRAVIVKALAECPVERWIDVSEFSRYMQAAGHRFEISRDLWTLYIVDRNYGSLGYAGHGDWAIVQERYLLAFLFEYAATLGLIDVACVSPDEARSDFRQLWGADDLGFLSRYDGLLQFRINGLGAWCLGLAGKYTPSQPEASMVLQVLPNSDIVASAGATPGDLLMLERFSTRVSDFVWRLDNIKLLEAVEQGLALSDIVAFLMAKAGGALPQNVAISLREMEQRIGQLTDRGPAQVIEVQDPILARLIANDSRLRSLCLLAGEQHLVVLNENQKAFRRGLRELGYAWAPAR
jgi:hypothetical protein